MSSTLRIAVRKFEPFERGIVQQFDDFVRATGVDASIEIAAMDLNPMHEALFERRELASGKWDIAFLSTDWIAEAQHAGLVENLLPFLDREPISDYPEAWRPSMLGQQNFDGGLWGMPYHDGPECLIYRTDLLAQRGIAVPRTWDEFTDAARRLHAPADNVHGTALALFPDGHNGFYDFLIHVWTRGGEPFDADGRPHLQTPEAHAALDFLRALSNDRTATPGDQREIDSVRAGLAFCAGNVAIMVNWFGFAALADTSAESRVKGRVDVAPIPCALGMRPVSLNVYWLLCMASGSRNRRLAWRFMRHCASAPMDLLTTLSGAIGVRRSTWSDAGINQAIPYYHKLDLLHEHARETPRHPRLAEISHVIDEMISTAVTTSESSAVLLANAQRLIAEITR